MEASVRFRARVRTAIEGIAGDAEPTRRLRCLRALIPRDEDVALVFRAGVARSLAAWYRELWPQLSWPIEPTQTELAVEVARAEDLVAAVAGFPAAYAAVADHLVPGVPWAAGTFRAPGARAGIVLDGLAAAGDRVVWFPKPWRALAAHEQTRTLSHWAEL